MRDLDKEILDIIRVHPGISKRFIHNKLSNHMRAELTNETLGYLETQGLVTKKIFKTGGRPATRESRKEVIYRSSERKPF